MKKIIFSRIKLNPNMARKVKPVLCVGSFHWDEIALSNDFLEFGDDAPGTIHKNPGGVSFNIAKSLTEFGIPVFLGSVLGDDPEGQELLSIAKGLGINCELICKSSQNTGKYIAIEDLRGLVAAVADCSSLEINEELLLKKLIVWGKLRTVEEDISGLVIDGNLSRNFIDALYNCPYFNNYPVYFASASSYKIDRLSKFEFRTNLSILYLNLIEAKRLLANEISDGLASQDYIQALLNRFDRVILTDGENEIIDADSREVFKFAPESIQPHTITGAGDYFMAAHIALELLGYSRIASLEEACNFVRGKIA